MTPGERNDARERIMGEEVTGARMTGPDGTIIEDGRVVFAGPGAIVDADGGLIGMRPATLGASRARSEPESGAG
jgi:hypothetical protein